MAKQILFDEVARTAIKKGIDKLSQAVVMTLGPRGRASIIEQSYGAPQVTFDGVTVAKEIELEDKYENLGAQLIKEAADKTNDNVGDGTTTSIVLAKAMIDEGEKLVQERGFNVIQLAEALKTAGKTIIKALQEQGEAIDDNKKIEEVASLSAKDKEIGKLIADVMIKVGKDGVVTVDDSNTIGSSFDVVEGMQFDRGYISQYMITDTDRMEAVFEHPYILVTDKKISAINEIVPLLNKIAESGKKELVIIADEIEGEALATLIVNKLRGTFNTLAVKAPGFGDRKKEILEDVAIVTGATFVSEDIGKKFDTIELDDLGTASKVVSDKENTTIVGGEGAKDKIDERIKQIRSQVQKADSSFDKEKLQERLGKLSGGVAVIKVGAPTEAAQKELKDRVNDAVNATKAAMEEGIVPGGGMALFNVNLHLKNSPEESQKEAGAALTIINRALRAPFEAIILNSGGSEEIINELERRKQESKDHWLGFNAFTNKIDDLKEAGISDPLKVTKTALINAVSVAANYLTIGAAITEVPKKEEDTQAGGGMPGMM